MHASREQVTEIIRTVSLVTAIGLAGAVNVIFQNELKDEISRELSGMKNDVAHLEVHLDALGRDVNALGEGIGNIEERLDQRDAYLSTPTVIFAATPQP